LVELVLDADLELEGPKAAFGPAGCRGSHFLWRAGDERGVAFDRAGSAHAEQPPDRAARLLSNQVEQGELDGSQHRWRNPRLEATLEQRDDSVAPQVSPLQDRPAGCLELGNDCR